MDGILHNASQEQVFETVGADVVNRALDGYNGKFPKCVCLKIIQDGGILFE